MTAPARRDRSYQSGDWYGVVGSEVLVLLPPEERHRVATTWALADAGAGFDETLDALISGGLRDLHGFVLVSASEGDTKVVIRGAARAVFTAGGEEVVVEGSAASTWVERSLHDVESMVLEVGEVAPGTPSYAMDLGLVRVARLVEGAADAVPAAPAPAPPASPAVVAEPEPEPDPEPVVDEPEPEPEAEPGPAAGPSLVAVPPLVEDADDDEGSVDDEASEAEDGAGATGPAGVTPGPVPLAEPGSLEASFDLSPDGAPEAAPEADAPSQPEQPVVDLGPTEAFDPDDVPDPAEVGDDLPDTEPDAEPEPEASADPEPDARPAWRDQAAPSADADGWAPDHDGATSLQPFESADYALARPGIPGQPPAPAMTSRPVAKLVLSTGEEHLVDRIIVFGRAPAARRYGPDEHPVLVTVPSPHQEISSTHVEVRPGSGADHGTAVVTDLGSTNGTVVAQPGLDPEELQPGISVQLIPGAVIDLGDGVSISVTRP